MQMQFDGLALIEKKASDIDVAVTGTRAAFKDRRWPSLLPTQRKRTMIRFADLLLEHANVLALTETLNMGKPIKYSHAVAVKSAAKHGDINNAA
jgi:4-guanidinobutyraldehyde dehydrogenase / NAD-dependent aldehyde dehydrogenase